MLRTLRFTCGDTLQFLPVITSVDLSTINADEKTLFTEAAQDLKVNVEDLNNNFFNFIWTSKANAACSTQNSQNGGFCNTEVRSQRPVAKIDGVCQVWSSSPVNGMNSSVNSLKESLGRLLCLEECLKIKPEYQFSLPDELHKTPVSTEVAPVQESYEDVDFSNYAFFDDKPQIQDSIFGRDVPSQPIYKLDLGLYDVPKDYNLTFSIKPLGTTSGWGNIFNLEKSAFSKVAAFLYPWSMKLRVLITNDLKWDWGMDCPLLPKDVYTQVSILAVSNVIEIYYNGTLVAQDIAPAKRDSGISTFWVSSWWYTPVNALLKSFRMTEVDALTRLATIASKSMSNTPLGSAIGVNLTRSSYMGEFLVPLHYNLTLDIRPTRIVDWGNILHLTQNNRDDSSTSRVLSLFYYGFTTTLHVSFSTSRANDVNFQATPLPMESWTRVSVVVVHDRLTVSYNGTVVINDARISGTRPYGPAHLYASNPWSESSAAVVRNLQLVGIAEPPLLNVFKNTIYASKDGAKLIQGNLLGQFDFPDDYNLTFHLFPNSVKPVWQSIIHFHNGSDILRMPGVFMHPSSLKLQFAIGHMQQYFFAFDTPAILLNAWTKVTLLAVKSSLKVYYNDKIVKESEVWSDRYVATATVEAGSRFYAAMDGRMKLLSMTLASMSSNHDLLGTKNMLHETLYGSTDGSIPSPGGYLGKYEVPNDFNLTFSFKPTALSGNHSNLIHFTKSDRDCCEV